MLSTQGASKRDLLYPLLRRKWDELDPTVPLDLWSCPNFIQTVHYAFGGVILNS